MFSSGRAIALAALLLAASAVPTMASHDCTPDTEDWILDTGLDTDDACPEGGLPSLGDGGDDGDGSDTGETTNTEFVTEVEGVNLSNATEVENATLRIKDKAKKNLSVIREALIATTNISELVNASYSQVFSADPGVDGQRSTSGTDIDSTDLADSSIKLHDEIGEPLSASQKLEVTSDAEEVPDDVAAAGATLNYATIDALHYAEDALSDVNETELRIVSENRTFFTMYQRVIEFEQRNGTPNMTLNSVQEDILAAATNVSAHVNITDLYKAADVLGEAIDEIQQTYDFGALEGRGDEPGDDCTRGTQKIFFKTPKCIIVIGGTRDQNYARDGLLNKNWVLLDIGGSDEYRHRAGGGYSDPARSTQPRVQVNADFAGADSPDDDYLASGDKESPCACGLEGGAFHGAGSKGVGLLYDESGDDDYRGQLKKVDTSAVRGVGQGAGRLGIGLLVDDQGSDEYLSFQTQTDEELNSQGFGGLVGAGILADRAGRDQYKFEVSKPGTADIVDAGGAQGVGTAGIGYLVDFGDSNDTYSAGQGLVQGASAWQGWAYLLDEGADNAANEFILRATYGCPRFDILPGVEDPNLDDDVEPGDCETPTRPVASWGQGYAITGGYVGFHASTDSELHQLKIAEDSSNETWVGRQTLGAGNTTGAAIVLDPGGNDTYEANQRALGYGNRGLGVYVNLGTDGTFDDYNCADATCYAYGKNLTTDLTKISDDLARGAGLGAFYDGADDADAFATDQHPGTRSPDDPEDEVWTKGDLGVGVDQ